MFKCALVFLVAFPQFDEAKTTAEQITLSDKRILGGWKVSNIEEHPYHVAIVAWDKWFSIFGYEVGEWFYKCGGTIIRRDWIITAAHCVVDRNLEKLKIAVAVGYTHIRHTWQIFNDWFKEVELLEVYPCYVQAREAEGHPPIHDVAIAKLKSELIWSSKVTIAYLWEKYRAAKVGSELITTGFGRTNPQGNPRNTDFYATKVAIISPESCKNSWGSEFIGDSTLCVQGYNPYLAATCPGDSGSPAAFREKSGMYVLIGVNSWGAHCNLSSRPEIFMDARYYAKWIHQMMYYHDYYPIRGPPSANCGSY